MPRLTVEQKAERALGLGATDISTAAGLNPFQSTFELYLVKIGELDPDATIDEAAEGRMERGHRLEDVALEWDRDISGEAFERVNRTVWHPRIPFIYCHPDARRKPWRETRRLIEVKTSNRLWKEVPRHVEAQCQVQMACTGASVVDVVILTFDGPPTRLVVERDDSLIDALERVAVAFWDRVQRRDPPPIDGSRGASTWLGSTRWGDEPETRADSGQEDLIKRLVILDQNRKQLEHDRDLLINQLKFTMLSGSRVYVPNVGRVIWTAESTRRIVSWKEVAAAFRHAFESLVAERPDVQEVLDRLGLHDADAVVSLYTQERKQDSFIVRDEREGAA